MNYNDELNKLEALGNYRNINKFVMQHTYDYCKEYNILKESIKNTLDNSYVIYENDQIIMNDDEYGKSSNIIVSGNRSFEAATKYIGKKIAVLNFANNHSIGGSPWYAGAQEESLCRCSTLYPCLEYFKEDFYQKHINMANDLYFQEFGNDDLIYLKDIKVFKTDDSTPKLMNENDWYNVDIITCAAPDLNYVINVNGYREIIYKRIERILSVAAKEKVEVLILGAFGCGAFHNPPEVVATCFKLLLNKYHFDTVEFAVYNNKDDIFSNYNIFKNILG